MSSHSSHHPQEVLLAQFSLYVQKDGLNPHSSFHFHDDTIISEDLLSLADKMSILFRKFLGQLIRGQYGMAQFRCIVENILQMNYIYDNSVAQ